MIAIVDDDPAQLAFLREVLGRAGYTVAAFGGAEAALAGLEGSEPQLVIADVVMPGMSGLELARAYASRFTDRRTPFVFLSSLGETADVVRGLDAGADDYLQKPVSPELLVAKVRAHLRRAPPLAGRAFQGDLARLPFARIVEFCELQALTGEVEVVSGSFRAVIGFRGGEILERGPQDGEAIARALEAEAGTFAIRALPVDFAGIASTAVPLGVEVPLDPAGRPAGRLSSVGIGNRSILLQTEHVGTPSSMVVSVALRDGRTLLKRTVGVTGARLEIERIVEAQHAELEREVRGRLAELAAVRAGKAAEPAAPTPASAEEAAPPAAPATPPAAQPARPAAPPAPADARGFGELFDAGLDAFLQGDLRRALTLFEQAEALEPGHPTLQVNLSVVRRKLGAA